MCFQDSQVWEITGAEFTKSESHTADGISIRFPRCTKMRDDKTWKEATSLPELKVVALELGKFACIGLEFKGHLKTSHIIYV